MLVKQAVMLALYSRKAAELEIRGKVWFSLQTSRSEI